MRGSIYSPDDGDDEDLDPFYAGERLNGNQERLEDDVPPDGLLYSPDRPLAKFCKTCGGAGVVPAAEDDHHNFNVCEACTGLGSLGIDPAAPTICWPGSNGKVAVLATRYRAGLPLHLPDDASEAEFEYSGAQ